MIYGFIGFLGCYSALRRLGCLKISCVLGATLFICSNWFALHFFEGHIAFGSMQILPLVLLGLLEIDRPAVVVIAALVASLVLLDGGVNALIFAVLLGASLVVFVPECRSKLSKSTKQHRRYWVLSLFSASLVTLPKSVPVLFATYKRIPILDFYSMSFLDLSQALMNPFKSIYDVLPTAASGYRFHEFACYISIAALVMAIAAMVKLRGFFADNRGWIVGVLFWFWVGSGWGSIINPWKIFHFLPLINNAHVQSRVFILMYLFFVVTIAKAFDAFRRRSARVMAIFPILVAEAVIVRNIAATFPSNISFRPPGLFTFIESDRIDKTLPYAFQVSHYLDQPNTTSSTCYEPSFQPRWIKASDDRHYKGEIWIEPPENGSAVLTKVVPGKIEFDYQIAAPAVVGINSNALFGWEVVKGRGDSSGIGTDLLAFKPDQPGTEHVTLLYRPVYLNAVIFGFIIGILLFIHTLRRCAKP